jgi:ABC-type multidrug transport system ATPase subunit
MIVIASIHQPSTSTLLLFDNVLLLSEGRTAYYGPPGDSPEYFTSKGYTAPAMMSPAEFMLELTNIDFIRDREHSLAELISKWQLSTEKQTLDYKIKTDVAEFCPICVSSGVPQDQGKNLLRQSFILLHRMALVLPYLLY